MSKTQNPNTSTTLLKIQNQKNSQHLDNSLKNETQKFPNTWAIGLKPKILNTSTTMSILVEKLFIFHSLY